MKYKCISLTQPYATLIAIGVKKIETRSWSTSFRGPLLIHAAKGLGPVGGKSGLWDLCSCEPFASALRDYGLPSALPLGAIVAVCELAYVQTTDEISRLNIRKFSRGALVWDLTDQERAFGDYSDGRYAWLLADVRPLPEPIPARGALGLWDWEGGDL